MDNGGKGMLIVIVKYNYNMCDFVIIKDQLEVSKIMKELFLKGVKL